MRVDLFAPQVLCGQLNADKYIESKHGSLAMCSDVAVLRIRIKRLREIHLAQRPGLVSAN